MSWLIILGSLLLLNINNIKTHGIRVVFILSSSKKTISKICFSDKINFKMLKEIITKRGIDKIKNMKLCEVYFPLNEFRHLLSGIVIFIVYYFIVGR
ncbi:TPA: hypothetical protein ROX98_002079 [Bacillus pseudomycoides]|nr:hypothetical protein [Bacillus pseudomycoides]